MANPLLSAALAYAARGYGVFPCWPGGKEPIGHLAPRGLLDASTTPAQIVAWWTSSPAANIGLSTDGLLVVDCDRNTGGLAYLSTAPAGWLAPTCTSYTGGGGQHLLYRRPPGRPRLGNSASKLAPGVDIRADGGYIIAPPSVHQSGALYRWAAGWGLDTRPPTVAHGALLATLLALKPAVPVVAPGTPPARLVDGLTRFALAGQPEGERNQGGFWLACRCCDQGLSDHATAQLLAAYGAACNPALTPDELYKIRQSAHRASRRAPLVPSRLLVGVSR